MTYPPVVSSPSAPPPPHPPAAPSQPFPRHGPPPRKQPRHQHNNSTSGARSTPRSVLPIDAVLPLQVPPPATGLHHHHHHQHHAPPPHPPHPSAPLSVYATAYTSPPPVSSTHIIYAPQQQLLPLPPLYPLQPLSHKYAPQFVTTAPANVAPAMNMRVPPPHVRVTAQLPIVVAGPPIAAEPSPYDRMAPVALAMPEHLLPLAPVEIVKTTPAASTRPAVRLAPTFTHPTDITAPSKFRAKLPWFSSPESAYPTKRSRKSKKHLLARIRQLETDLGITYDQVIEQSAKFDLDLTLLYRQRLRHNDDGCAGAGEPAETASNISSPFTPLPTTAADKAEPQTTASPDASCPNSSTTTTTASERSVLKSWADIVKPAGGASTIAPASNTAPTRVVARQLQVGTGGPPLSTPSEPLSPSSTSTLSSATHSSDATEIEASVSPAALDDIFDVPAPILMQRGLVNMGNMCFMNSILQILLYCAPFYSFIDIMSRKLAHRFNSDTPVLDSLILFIQEFDPKLARSIGNIDTPDLRQSEPFVPEFVYNAIRSNSLFAHMRRGHQEDAEEFLGFLLHGLHEEFLLIAKNLRQKDLSADGGTAMNFVEAALADLTVDDGSAEDGWLEVCKNQKFAVRRATTVLSSPITKIFGGLFRSVVNAAHQKPSVTLDPYQRVQLDISDPHVHTIEDALAKISQPEVIKEYKTSHGELVEANKQTLLERLPKVLILHLKRFQFVTVDESSGYSTVQKISKTIGFKRNLQIPTECIAPQQRNAAVNYALFGVVYHHGKSTEGGHYTVDLHYKHGDCWVNFDDINIKRIDPEAVEAVYEDENSARKRLQTGSDADDRTAYLLFYERI
ncbi:uncharacterized protein V1518DRAFT_409995 [Limtongia smithiae]|uniref:uncharacterized protein n=1 Tax=Limtongia smithiae TaxID=1125753 RepID=UPI0034CFA9AD